ncbi:dehydrogenase/reductase SDR family member 7 [Onthophagus taurus]|uniref:dehydrogenase/reductase SDR family member 7 n=1 Tax=Onthophagus taurus TaxID=166361 RepID=UPI000C2043FE|nr:dehydrogenase/reductase SDR family member 7 [Onthophagus taurus]
MFFSLIGIGCIIYGLIYLCTLFFDADLELKFYEKFGKPISHLRGKVVFVTGASSGIGEHIAKSLAKNGVKLVLAARRQDELERVKRECLEISNGSLSSNDILVLVMDMVDIQFHKKHFDHAVRHFGGVDILVNNAGRSQRAMWENISMEVDKQMFDLNVFSVIHLSRVAMEHFNQRGEGHIAVTSSLAGVMGVPFSGTYTGSKYAIHGYFNCLRTEKIGKRLFVTLLCPGPTFTNFLQNCFTEKEGENYSETVQPTDKRMTGQRCGELCAIALANKQEEAWIAIQPLITFLYVAVYMPNIFKWGLRILGPETLFKLRDSRDTTVLREDKMQ